MTPLQAELLHFGVGVGLFGSVEAFSASGAVHAASVAGGPPVGRDVLIEFAEQFPKAHAPDRNGQGEH